MALKIMVVDDEPAILSIIKAFVDPLGCEVTTIQDSRDAAKMVQTRKFDGIFVDAKMPHLDGFQLTQCIRESPSNSTAPIVMLTGCDDVATMRQGFKAGITIFLGTPVTQERMVRVVNALRGAFLKEKRHYVRLILRTPVICKWKNHGPHRSKSSCLDISEGGMALMEANDIDLGFELELEFHLPEVTDPIRLRSQMVRKMPPDGIGVSFIDVALPVRRSIQRYIAGSVMN